MHWAVRVSFERGFIDYIKHGNEQRLQGLSDALGNSIACTVTGVFCATTIALYFKFCARWSTIVTTTVRDRACRRTAGAPSSVIDQEMRVLVGPRSPVPPDGTKRAITSNGATVGWVIASPVERLTRNTDINFDRQQRQTSWLIVALSTLLAALATFRWRAACWRRLSARWKARTSWRRVISRPAWTPAAGMNWASWRRTSTSSPARWKKPADAPRFYGRHFARAAHRWRCCAASWRRFRTACGSSPRVGGLASGGSRYADQTGGRSASAFHVRRRRRLTRKHRSM